MGCIRFWFIMGLEYINKMSSEFVVDRGSVSSSHIPRKVHADPLK